MQVLSSLLTILIGRVKQNPWPTCYQPIIDDFAAELDVTNRAKLLHYLSKMECQVFITATEISDFGDLNFINNYKMFHVEHGNIKQV